MSGIVSLDCRKEGEPERLLSGSLACTLGLQLKFFNYTHILLKTDTRDDVDQVSDIC